MLPALEESPYTARLVAATLGRTSCCYSSRARTLFLLIPRSRCLRPPWIHDPAIKRPTDRRQQLERPFLLSCFSGAKSKQSGRAAAWPGLGAPSDRYPQRRLVQMPRMHAVSFITGRRCIPSQIAGRLAMGQTRQTETESASVRSRSRFINGADNMGHLNLWPKSSRGIHLG